MEDLNNNAQNVDNGVENEKPLVVSSLDDFNRQSKDRKDGKLIQLPSGLVCRVIRPQVTLLLRNGSIPASLVNAALRADSRAQVATVAELNEQVDFMNTMVGIVVKEPSLTKEQISEEMDEYDKGVIMDYVQRGDLALQSFRGTGQKQDTGHNMQAVSGDKA